MWEQINKHKLHLKYIDTVELMLTLNDCDIKIHPTQKPVKLYEWLLTNYAKENDKILDTHLGSGSIAIACHNMKYDLTACELDTEYYNSAIKRLKQHTNQQRLIFSYL